MQVSLGVVDWRQITSCGSTQAFFDWLDGTFDAWVEQHARMVQLAVSNGYGLLGHCG